MSRAPEMFVCSGVCCAGRGGCRRDECVSRGRAERVFLSCKTSLQSPLSCVALRFDWLVGAGLRSAACFQVVQRCAAWTCRMLVGAVMEQLVHDGACWPVALH